MSERLEAQHFPLLPSFPVTLKLSNACLHPGIHVLVFIGQPKSIARGRRTLLRLRLTQFSSSARLDDLQGRKAARGVLRLAATEVPARVRVLERRGRAARQARAAGVTAARPAPARAPAAPAAPRPAPLAPPLLLALLVNAALRATRDTLRVSSKRRVIPKIWTRACPH